MNIFHYLPIPKAMTIERSSKKMNIWEKVDSRNLRSSRSYDAFCNKNVTSK